MAAPEPIDQAVDIRAALNADLDNCGPAPTGEPIRVGMAMDFSDVVGFVDIPGSKLVPHFANLVNCIGGINGSPVEVRVEDVGGDATTAGVAPSNCSTGEHTSSSARPSRTSPCRSCRPPAARCRYSWPHRPSPRSPT